MGKLAEFTDALIGSARTINSVYDNQITQQATLSTQTKNIQLQNDINGQLARIRQSSNYEDWNTQMNDFFTQVKSGMSNKDSPYYCQNNLQAEQFTKILEQNQVNVSDQVNRMVQQQQVQKSKIDVNKGLLGLQEMGLVGQQYYDEAKKLVDSAYAIGAYSQEEYENMLDNNFMTGYSSMYENMFNDTVQQSIERGDSFETIWNMMENTAPKMMKTDGDNMPSAFDKKSYDKVIKKTLQQTYNAKLADIQNQNAAKLSEIVQQMRQTNTAEGKLSVARDGQSAMNNMKGIQLSETDRLQYSAIFELALGGDGLKGSGSGSGSGAKASDFDKYSDIMKASPENYKQLVQDGVFPNYHVAVSAASQVLREEWYGGNYQENFDKDTAERDETFNLVYLGATSEETLSNKIFDLLLEDYPTAKNLVKNDYEKLINDINKNPNKYGNATVGDLSDWMMDTLLGADANYTDEQFAKDFQNHINSCYAESIKYVQLDKKGNLEKKFNADSVRDIASAARLAQENDFVYTYEGQERWGEGKKEALEAEGGVVDVLKNAVAGTLKIPESERGKVSFYYKPDAQHDDLTSTPIITYGNKGYEVIPNDDNKGFKLKEVHTGEIIDGTTGIKEATAERKEAKAEAKATEKAAAENVATIRKEREKKVEESLTNSKETPKAISASNVISSEEKDWKWKVSTNEDKKTILNQSINKIDKAADKVKDTLAGKAKKKNQMTKEQFKQEYGIDYDEWIKDTETSRRYELIINSK